VSAREAFNYADAVHDPYDTPVYSESTPIAGTCHLGQRYVWWWWYCPLIVSLLEVHYLRLPLPEFYERLHGNVVPQLEKIEELLDRDSKILRGEVEPKSAKSSPGDSKEHAFPRERFTNGTSGTAGRCEHAMLR
jgi:hypothetical protein